MRKSNLPVFHDLWKACVFMYAKGKIGAVLTVIDTLTANLRCINSNSQYVEKYKIRDGGTRSYL